MTALIDDSPRVPVILPHLRIVITAAGDLEVHLDKAPYDVPPAWHELGRDAVPKIVDDVKRGLDSPVRVDVVDDGATFTDIVTPDSSAAAAVVEHPRCDRIPGEFLASGFLPGEPVAVAVVVAHQVAGADGTACLRVPPALLDGRPGQVLLLGKTTGNVAFSGGTP